MTADFYNKHAAQHADRYLSKTFEQVHSSWLEYLAPILTKADARILDLGAGAGRDSCDERVMHKVSADELIKLGSNVELTAVSVTGHENDLIGRSAVSWQTVVLQSQADCINIKAAH